METARTPLTITFSVWKALFLREAVYRLFSVRGAWAWLILEPVAQIAFMMFIFGAIRVHTVGGVHTPLWFMAGMLAFFMFRRTASQAMGAIGANQALFAYRQVKPVDTVLTRSALEGFLTLLIALVVFAGAALFQVEVLPADPLAVAEAFTGMWLAGVGFGLIASVANELVGELGKVVNVAMTPLYFASGVMFPIAPLPPVYREWLMWNPLAHGIEAARLGFVPHYQAVPELDIGYLHGFALVTIFFGLALHVRFAARLTTQ